MSLVFITFYQICILLLFIIFKLYSNILFQFVIIHTNCLVISLVRDYLLQENFTFSHFHYIICLIRYLIIRTIILQADLVFFQLIITRAFSIIKQVVCFIVIII
jgi:hypothetical protein